MDSSRFATRALVGIVAVSAILRGGGAFANIRAPRTEFANPSSAVRPAVDAPPLRVLHEDLTFACHGRSCEVTATYSIQADAAASADLGFVLPIETAVIATVGAATVSATVKRMNAAPPGFARRLDLRHEYMVPHGEPLPPLYEAAVRVSFVRGWNRVSFSYQQPLGAVELGHSYFHDGTMVPRLFYVLWPLHEWKLAPGFTVSLRIEMDREPPGWWKRKFGHPAEVACAQVRGQQVQVGRQLVYTATLTDTFPDYLDCDVGP